MLQTHKLNDPAIRAAHFDGKAIKMFDGGGLYLHVQKHGKYWRWKYRFAGQGRVLPLGVYPRVSLAEARKEHKAQRVLLDSGADPAAQRREQKAKDRLAVENTFEAIAREWWQDVHRHDVVPDHAERNRRRLEKHVFPDLGRQPIKDITQAGLLAVLRRLERKGVVTTAHRVRYVCAQVYDYAIRTDRATRNVADDLRKALRKPKVRHREALTDPNDVAGLLRAIQGYGGHPETTAFLKLAPLLFARTGELLNAQWVEFDLAGRTWDFKPSKGGSPMITPLPSQAVEILRELHALTGTTGPVFLSPSGTGKPLSNTAVNGALRALGYTVTIHGFRATARTLLVERLGFRTEVVEMQLGHAVRDPLGRAYNRTTFLEQRREMLQRWADYLEELRLR